MAAAASLPPAFMASKYGMPAILGTNATLILALEPSLAPAVDVSFLLVQPVTASKLTIVNAASVVSVDFLFTYFS
ncbi:hypothetical protein [Arthrobacter psychrolactophilus]